MPRPSISGLFDSTIRVWRYTTTLDDVRTEQRTYHVIVESTGAAINRSAAPQVPNDGGMQYSGQVRLYVLPNVDVQARDVVQVLTGPDAGRNWEVDAPPVRPRNHHTQLDCVEFHGELQVSES